MSGYRCVSDYWSRGHEFYPGPVLYFHGIGHEIISLVITLPSSESFKKGCCQLQAEVCARSTGKTPVKMPLRKSCLCASIWWICCEYSANCIVHSNCSLYIHFLSRIPSEQSWSDKKVQGFRFFFKIGGPKWPMEQKMVGHFLKWWAQAYQTYHSWHWGNILYLHTDTDIKTCLKRPLKKDQLSLNAGQKYCRLLQGSILQSFWPSLSYHMFSRLAERWIFLLVRFFHILKRWVHWAHCFGKWWAISWNHGTMTRAHHKSEGLKVIAECLQFVI